MKLGEIWNDLVPGDRFISTSSDLANEEGIKIDDHRFEWVYMNIPIIVEVKDYTDFNIEDWTVSNSNEVISNSGFKLLNISKCSCDFHSQILPYGCICGGC